MRALLLSIADERKIETAIKKAAKALAPDVVRIRYTIGKDSTDDDAIFVRVLLTDEASKPPGLYKTTQRIKAKIEDLLDPREKFGLLSYFNFRNESEQAELKNPAWD